MFVFVLIVALISTVLFVQSEETPVAKSTSNENILPVSAELRLKTKIVADRRLGAKHKAPADAAAFIKLIEDPSCYCSGCTSLNHSGKGAASKFTICCVPGEKCMCCEKFDASYEKYRTGVIDTTNKDHAKYVTLNNALFVMFPKNFVKKTAAKTAKTT